MSASLQPNPLIAVTGISGFIGSHVGLAALRAGHRVRGTVRSLKRAQSLNTAYIAQGIPEVDIENRLDFVIVDDLLSTEQWQRALEGVDGVIHLALPMGEAFTKAGWPDIAVESTLAILRAATHVTSIKRVVLTSSSTAVVSPPVYKDKVLTDQDWNDDNMRRVEQATGADMQTAFWRLWVYAYGKTRAEKAAWDFMTKEKPHFDMATVLPNANFGPIILHEGESHTTPRYITALLRNDTQYTQSVPPQWFIDVRDDARLHVLALTTPSLGGKRILAFAEPFGWNQILAILRKHFPSVQLPADIEGSRGQQDRQEIDSELARNLLGGWIGLEQSLVDMCKSLGY